MYDSANKWLWGYIKWLLFKYLISSENFDFLWHHDMSTWKYHNRLSISYLSKGRRNIFEIRTHTIFRWKSWTGIRNYWTFHQGKLNKIKSNERTIFFDFLAIFLNLAIKNSRTKIFHDADHKIFWGPIFG